MPEKNEEQKKSKDPYTGEDSPEAEDADSVIEIMPVDTGDREGKNYLLTEETSMDMVAADKDADAVAQNLSRYTEDESIEDDMEARQQLSSGGRESLKDELEQYHSKSPKLSGGDIDADWQSASSTGEEAVGGSAPTPDQDVVDELGEAVGLVYEDDETLESEEKFLQRDRKRWELAPESVDDEGEENRQEE